MDKDSYNEWRLGFESCDTSVLLLDNEAANPEHNTHINKTYSTIHSA